MDNPFKLTDLPDNTWAVSWPGFEYNVVNNPGKAHNLLDILFNEVKVTGAMLGCHEYNHPDKFETMHINLSAWCRDSRALAEHVVDHHIITGCKFDTLEEAEKFKDIMEKRLAWRRLSNAKWS